MTAKQTPAASDQRAITIARRAERAARAAADRELVLIQELGQVRAQVDRLGREFLSMRKALAGPTFEE